MKRIATAILVLLGGVSLETAAQPMMTTPCANGTQIKGNLQTLLSGNTVCAKTGEGTGLETWQEEHHPGGDLYDYKMGPDDPVDPRVKVGSWKVTGTGSNTRVEYTYGKSEPSDDVVSLSVHTNRSVPNSFFLCTGPRGTVKATVFVQTGTDKACASSP